MGRLVFFILSMMMALVLAGYVLARNSLAPVTDMSRQANQIGAANLHERIPGADLAGRPGPPRRTSA